MRQNTLILFCKLHKISYNKSISKKLGGKMERQNTVKSKSVKLILIILAVVFVLSAITVPVVVTTTRNDATATNQSADSSIGNLYNTDGTLNNTNVKKFLGKLGADNLVSTKPTLTSPQIALRVGTSGSFVFEMGYYVSTSGAITTSKPIKWQAVYSRNGYLTIWMANNYTTDVFNDYGGSESGWGSSTEYGRFSNYSKSTLRDCANGIFNKLSEKFNNLSSIIVSPSVANATWQATQSDLNCAKSGSETVYIHHSGLKSYSGSYSGWSNSNWDTANPPYNDEFWIPSWNEVYRNTSDTSKTFSSMPDLDGGIWGLTAEDLKVESTALDGKSSNSFWLRSGNSSYDSNATAISGSSAIGYSWVYHAYGVRPACHMNLNSLISLVGYVEYNITASVSNADENKATVDKTGGVFVSGFDTKSTFTFSAFGQYYISEMRINGTLIEISDSVSGFSTLSSGKYKCYRVNNKVIVTVTDLIADMNIVATYTEALVTVSSFDPTLELKQDSMYTITDSNGYRVKIVATFVQSERVKLCVDGAWANLTGKNGRGTIRVDGNEIEYAHFIYNNYITIEVSKLPISQHLIYIDHYISGIGGNINTSLSGASASSYIDQYTGDNGENIILVNPANGEYVYEMQINNVAVPIEYYKAEVYGVGGAVTVNYVAPDESCTSNQFVLVVSNLFSEMNIVFKVQNSAPSLKNPPTASGTAIVGTTVTASIGGEARIVGNNIASGSNTDTITVIAVAYSDYNFVGWVYADDENEILSNSASAVFTKEQANGKIIKALFTPKATNENSPNGQTNNTNEIV